MRVERRDALLGALEVINLVQQVGHYPLQSALLSVNQRLLLEQCLLLPIWVESVEELLAEGCR